jgi:hypothetical protein
MWFWSSLLPGVRPLPHLVDTGAATGKPAIHLAVHNGQPDELAVISAELESIARSCNWFNPCDPED